MLSKKKIDRKLRIYVKEHLRKGYSKHAVKKVLVNHGYDESYIDSLLRKHQELQLVKLYTILVSVLFMLSFFSFNLDFNKTKTQKITGLVTIGSNNEGCCTTICQHTLKNECFGKFVQNIKCDELQECNIGCCIDKEGYCLTNYLYGNCIENYGKYINKECNDVAFCRNITDTTSRQYKIKEKPGTSTPKPIIDYYKSSFNIKYYIYDKTDVIAVTAEIKDSSKLIDSISLYDDGYHNDGAKNDNLYGNNWPSSELDVFDGFKKLDINIVVRYSDGTQQLINNTQSIVVLNTNKCFPIFIDGETSSSKSIIFAADNYNNFSDGYQRFEADVQNFLNVILAIDKFANNLEKFNIYRLEQSLSYFNIPTLMSIISSSCPSYSNKKDLVVILDNSEEYCVSEGLRTFRTNPKTLFYKNISDSDLDKIFVDFCSYVLTPKKLADNILIFLTPPKIVMNILDNITYNTSLVNLSFGISALRYPLNYSVFLEDLLVLNKNTDYEIIDSIMLNLTNGSNAILIEVSDKNENIAFAQIWLNTTIE